jgi:rRNA maturation endonuclease Nob1
MQTLTIEKLNLNLNLNLKPKPKQNLLRLRRQTQMRCTVCEDVAESYSQNCCYRCGSFYKWSIPWKNEPQTELSHS